MPSRSVQAQRSKSSGRRRNNAHCSFIGERIMSIHRVFAITAAAAFFCVAPTARADDSQRELKIMTINMDAGTDLNLIFANYPDIATGASATMTQVVTTNIPGRVKRLAEEIRLSKPEFVALQEVTEWRTGVC